LRPPLAPDGLKRAQAIVILAAGLNRSAVEWGGETVDDFTLQRVRYGAHLARASGLPVYVTGGVPGDARHSVAEMMAGVLQRDYGIQPKWIDEAADTTRGNARMAAKDLKPLGIQRVALVTTAIHMPRSKQAFEAAGFTVIPAPTDFVAQRPFTPGQCAGGVPPFAARVGLARLVPAAGQLAPATDAHDRRRGEAMNTKPTLTLEDARRMAAAGEAEAKKNQWNVVIAVCDDGGHLILLHRLDGVAPISSYIAPEKARAAAMGKRETKIYEDMINQGRNAFLSAPLQGMLEGGVPVIVDGQVVGAVGVSGVKSSEDAQIAKAAIAALGN
jgi:glc operon protein GlcG